MSDETNLQPPIKISWFVWTLLAFLIFVVIGTYSSRMANRYTDFDDKRAEVRYANLAKLRATENETLTTADWVNQDKGTIRIPIDEAMAKEIDTLKAKPLAQGCEIPGAVPAAAPTTNAAMAPAATTNAAPVAPSTNAAPVSAAPPTTNAVTTPAKPAPAAKPTSAQPKE